MTAYCIKVLDEDPSVVTFFYSVVSITAPIPGAAMGGYLADKNVSLPCNYSKGRVQGQERPHSHKAMRSIRDASLHFRGTHRLPLEHRLHNAPALVAAFFWGSADSHSHWGGGQQRQQGEPGCQFLYESAYLQSWWVFPISSAICCCDGLVRGRSGGNDLGIQSVSVVVHVQLPLPDHDLDQCSAQVRKLPAVPRRKRRPQVSLRPRGTRTHNARA